LSLASLARKPVPNSTIFPIPLAFQARRHAPAFTA
jgi:hypothetical protein